MQDKFAGKFVVLEGMDGSGKRTQLQKLMRRLRNKKIPTKVFDFPRYSRQASYFVRKYLNGEYGGWRDVNPYCASLFYALDRFDAKKEIEKYLQEGKVLIANRYTPSNLGHQGAKILGREKRLAFFYWLYEMEYEILGIPKPTKTIILYVPAEIAWQLIYKRKREKNSVRRRDIHEVDFSHLKEAEASYLQVAKTFPQDFVVIECTKNGRFLTPDEIHQKVWQITEEILKA